MAPSIQMLPTDTTKLLGSSTIIASPYSVVKELMDNAIDAEATCVEITIAPDTTSKIQVRDNGFGISEDDFDSLGRRSHTSKLRSFDELRYKGGITMGFRGEALASLATMGAVTIVTRAKTAPVASVLEITPKTGGVLSKTHRPEPVGTTVILTGLFDELPVRKRVAKKARHLAKMHIKKLLHQCALSRPHVKLSLKMLGDSKITWSYTPNKTPSVRDAALQTFGQQLVSQCVYSLHRETGHAIDGDPVSRQATGGTIVMEAFWPTREANPKIISGYGCFISVDSRPVSTSRGVMRKINETFRKSLNTALGSRGPISMPFMQLAIKCPPGSYDPNVDALKEELIFTNNKRLLNIFGTFCHEMYATTAITEVDAYEFQPMTRASTAWSQRPYGPSVESFPQEIPADEVPDATGSLPQGYSEGVSQTPDDTAFDIYTLANLCDGDATVNQDSVDPAPKLETQNLEYMQFNQTLGDTAFDIYALTSLCGGDVAAVQDSADPAPELGTQNLECMQSSDEHHFNPVLITAQVRSRYITDMARTRTISYGEDTHAQDMDVILPETLMGILREQGNEPRDSTEHDGIGLGTPPPSSGLFVEEPSPPSIEGNPWVRSKETADARKAVQGMVESHDKLNDNSTPRPKSPSHTTMVPATNVNLPSVSFTVENVDAERTSSSQAQPPPGVLGSGSGTGPTRRTGTSVDLQTQYAFPSLTASLVVSRNASAMHTKRRTRHGRPPPAHPRKRKKDPSSNSMQTSQRSGRAHKPKQKPSVLSRIRDDAQHEMRHQRSAFDQMHAGASEGRTGFGKPKPSESQSHVSSSTYDSDDSESDTTSEPAQSSDKLKQTQLSMGVTKLPVASAGRSKNTRHAECPFAMDSPEPYRERSLSFDVQSEFDDFGPLVRTPLGEETNRYMSLIRADAASLRRALDQSQDLYASAARFIWGEEPLDETMEAQLEGVLQAWGYKSGEELAGFK